MSCDHEPLARTLPRERALLDLTAAVGFLRAQPSVRPDEIGVIGWPSGSGYALEVARQLLVQAVVLNSTPAIEAMPSLKTRIPVLGNFGTRDLAASPSRIRALRRALRADGVTVDFKVYRHAGCDFDSLERPGFRALVRAMPSVEPSRSSRLRSRDRRGSGNTEQTDERRLNASARTYGRKSIRAIVAQRSNRRANLGKGSPGLNIPVGDRMRSPPPTWRSGSPVNRPRP